MVVLGVLHKSKKVHKSLRLAFSVPIISVKYVSGQLVNNPNSTLTLYICFSTIYLEERHALAQCCLQRHIRK